MGKGQRLNSNLHSVYKNRNIKGHKHHSIWTQNNQYAMHFQKWSTHIENIYPRHLTFAVIVYGELAHYSYGCNEIYKSAGVQTKPKQVFRFCNSITMQISCWAVSIQPFVSAKPSRFVCGALIKWNKVLLFSFRHLTSLSGNGGRRICYINLFRRPLVAGIWRHGKTELK